MIKSFLPPPVSDEQVENGKRLVAYQVTVFQSEKFSKAFVLVDRVVVSDNAFAVNRRL